MKRFNACSRIGYQGHLNVSIAADAMGVRYAKGRPISTMKYRSAPLLPNKRDDKGSPMMFASPLTPARPLRQLISAAYTGDETECVEALLRTLVLDAEVRTRIQDRAHELVTAVRRRHHRQVTLEAFLHEYDLSSYEGEVLMCIACF